VPLAQRDSPSWRIRPWNRIVLASPWGEADADPEIALELPRARFRRGARGSRRGASLLRRIDATAASRRGRSAERRPLATRKASTLRTRSRRGARSSPRPRSPYRPLPHTSAIAATRSVRRSRGIGRSVGASAEPDPIMRTRPLGARGDGASARRRRSAGWSSPIPGLTRRKGSRGEYPLDAAVGRSSRAAPGDGAPASRRTRSTSRCAARAAWVISLYSHGVHGKSTTGLRQAGALLHA